jgi:hypothetical protein
MIIQTLLIALGLNLTLSPLEQAVWHVESNKCVSNCPTGDKGNAIGGLQIWRVCFDSVAKKGEKYSQCQDIEFSFIIFRRTMKRFCNDKRLTMILGRKPTKLDRLEAFAKCWNGGANWWKAKKGSKKYKNLTRYWNKVLKQYRKEIENGNKKKLKKRVNAD